MTERLFSKISGSLFLLLLAVILSAFLLSCKKNKVPASSDTPETHSESDETDVSLYDFYNPADDDASWVEALLVHIEEERIAEELAKMEEAMSDYQLEDSELNALNEEFENENTGDNESSEHEIDEEEKNPVDKFFEEAGNGKILTGKNNELRFYEFDNEILSPQKTSDGLVLVHSSDGSVMRNFYDNQYHLIKKEEWNIKSVSDAVKLKTEQFVYSEESSKVIHKDIITQNYFEALSYNEASLPVALKKYALMDDEKYIVMERFWYYDSQSRLIKDEQREYSYKNDNYKNKAELFSRRYEYIYPDIVNEEDEDKKQIPPDFKYFENNVLKMQNIYTLEKGSYYSWIYFDENLSVKTFYKNEIRIRDEYYNKGRLFRTKLYESSETDEGQKSVIRQGGEE